MGKQKNNSDGSVAMNLRPDVILFSKKLRCDEEINENSDHLEEDWGVCVLKSNEEENVFPNQLILAAVKRKVDRS